MSRPIQILLFTLLTVSLLYPQKIIFRYNADYSGTDLNSPVIEKGISLDNRYEDEEETARGADGWGYPAHKTALFYTDSSSIYSRDEVQLNYFGNHSVSAELWVKSYTGSSVLFSWDDPLQANGINLSLDDGKLVLSRKINNEIFTLNGTEPLNLQEWYNIIWTNKLDGTALTLTLIVNRENYASQNFTLQLPAGLTNFKAPVYIGNKYNADSSVFNGELFALLLRNYIPYDTYMYAALPFDGGGYMGLASFHDYPLNTGYTIMDRRIYDSPTPFVDPIFVPYSDEDFIPQGLTNSYEDESFTGKGMIYMAMYHKGLDNKTGGQNSIVVEIDPETKRIRRTFRLMGNLKISHVGGIAFHDNSIYVSSGRKIEVYPVPEYKEGDDKYQDLNTTSANLFNVASQASFTSYFNDTLWVGDYRLSSEGNPYLYGYPVNEDGSIASSAVPAVYRLPYQVQGAAWRKYGGEQYLFLSISGGDAGSKVWRIRQDKLSRTAVPAADTIFGVPAGGEDISFNAAGDLINQSESSAKLYQKRESNPWKTYFPFIFTIKEDVLFTGIVTGVKEESGAVITPSNYEVAGYPNPFNSSASISYKLPYDAEIELTIYDTLGSRVALLSSGFRTAGSYTAKWNASSASSGTYLAVLKAGGKVVSSGKLLLLK